MRNGGGAIVRAEAGAFGGPDRPTTTVAERRGVVRDPDDLPRIATRSAGMGDRPRRVPRGARRCTGSIAATVDLA
jgi:hypothetical protein